MLDFLQTSVSLNYLLRGSSVPDQQVTSYRDLFSYFETILVKLFTSPVSAYDLVAQDLFTSLVLATDPAYHRKLSDLIIDTVDAIFLEKKRGRAEDFKTKILLKLTHLISLVCQLSPEPATLSNVVRKMS